MSTAVLRRKSSKPNQLCFSWMQAERNQPPKGDSTIPRHQEKRVENRFENCLENHRAIQPTTRTALGKEKNQVSISVNRQERIGEAKLGTVMLALLKRYGITDQEISAELSAIASQAGS